MTTELKRQKQRRGTAAQWASNNPILGFGEFGIEWDTNKVKFGDGTSLWNALSYFPEAGGVYDADAMHYIGAWNSGSTYADNDVVTRTGVPYLALGAVAANVVPESTPLSWRALVEFPEAETAAAVDFLNYPRSSAFDGLPPILGADVGDRHYDTDEGVDFILIDYPIFLAEDNFNRTNDTAPNGIGDNLSDGEHTYSYVGAQANGIDDGKAWDQGRTFLIDTSEDGGDIYDNGGGVSIDYTWDGTGVLSLFLRAEGGGGNGFRMTLDEGGGIKLYLHNTLLYTVPAFDIFAGETHNWGFEMLPNTAGPVYPLRVLQDNIVLATYDHSGTSPAGYYNGFNLDTDGGVVGVLDNFRVKDYGPQHWNSTSVAPTPPFGTVTNPFPSTGFYLASDDDTEIFLVTVDVDGHLITTLV